MASVHAGAAIADVRPSLGAPEIAPQQVTVVRVERPDVVWCCHIEDAVDSEDRTLHDRRAAVHDVAFAAGDDRRFARQWRAARTRAGRKATRPRQRERLHVGAIDLFERAEPPARVVARIRRPRFAERPMEPIAVDALRGQRDRRRRDEHECRQLLHHLPLSDAR